jgi:hypothetical protein
MAGVLAALCSGLLLARRAPGERPQRHRGYRRERQPAGFKGTRGFELTRNACTEDEGLVAYEEEHLRQLQIEAIANLDLFTAAHSAARARWGDTITFQGKPWPTNTLLHPYAVLTGNFSITEASGSQAALEVFNERLRLVVQSNGSRDASSVARMMDRDGLPEAAAMIGEASRLEGIFRRFQSTTSQGATWRFIDRIAMLRRTGSCRLRPVLPAAALTLALIAAASVACRARSSDSAAAAGSGSSPASSVARSGDGPTIAALDEFRTAVKSGADGQWSILGTTALFPSDRGGWDDYRVGAPVVMRDDGRSRYRMWFIGCRLAADQHDCGIGHATSADGVEWVRSDSPVFVPPDLPAQHWLGTLAILKTANGYSMWYSLDGDRFAKRPHGTLHMATSADGVEWQNVGLVQTAGERRTIRHAVQHDGKTFHLWYSDATEEGGESFLHFTSPDGKTWTAVGGDTLDGRAASVGRPWVIADGRGGFRALLVDRSGEPTVRWFDSADGTRWTRGADELKARIPSDATSIVDVCGLREREGLWLWMTTALPRRSAESIGVAFKKGS